MTTPPWCREKVMVYYNYKTLSFISLWNSNIMVLVDNLFFEKRSPGFLPFFYLAPHL